MDTSDLKPGRELDALIAERVFSCHQLQQMSPSTGEIVKVCHCSDTRHWSMSGVKAYSTDIAVAWEVVEKLRPMFSFSLHDTGEDWECWLNAGDGGFLAKGDSEFLGRGDTAPHAICLAALKAVGAS